MAETNTGQTLDEKPSEGVEDANINENSDVKNHPLFKKITAQLADYQKSETAAKEAKDVAEKEEILRKAAESGKFEDAEKMYKEQIERMKISHSSEIQERDLQSSLAVAGFDNKMFIRGAVAGFDSTKTSIEDYVAELKSDELNKPFLRTASIVVKPQAPGTVAVNGGKTNWEDVKKLELSSKADDRAKARSLIADYRKETGEYPYKLGD